MHHGLSWGRAIWPEGSGDAEMTPRLSHVEKCKEILVVKPMNREPLISDETTSRVAFITGQWHGAECHSVSRVGDVATVTVNVKSLPEQAIALCRFHLSSWSQISCWYPFRPQINKVREQVPAWWEGFTLRARSPFPGSCLQSIKLDADKAVHPKQQAPARQDRLHPSPSQPLLLRQLLTFQPLPLCFIMTCWEDLGAQHNCSESVNRRPSRHKKINRIVVKEGEKKNHCISVQYTQMQEKSARDDPLEPTEDQHTHWGLHYIYSKDHKNLRFSSISTGSDGPASECIFCKCFGGGYAQARSSGSRAFVTLPSRLSFKPPCTLSFEYFIEVVSLQCCVNFWCTAEWINCLCTYIHFLLDFLSIKVTTEHWIVPWVIH